MDDISRSACALGQLTVRDQASSNGAGRAVYSQAKLHSAGHVINRAHDMLSIARSVLASN